MHDAGEETWRASAVGVGEGLAAARRALAARVDPASGLYAQLVAGVEALGAQPGRVRLESLSRPAAGRVVTLSLELGLPDGDTAELIEACDGDPLTQAELFASAQRGVVARRVAWPAASAHDAARAL